MDNKERAQFWIEKAEAWLMQDPPNVEASKAALEIARELRIAAAYYALQQKEKAASKTESKSAKASTAAWSPAKGSRHGLPPVDPAKS